MVLIAYERAEDGRPNPLETEFDAEHYFRDFEEIESNNPLLEIHTNCTRNDFDLARLPQEIEEFAKMLLRGG